LRRTFKRRESKDIACMAWNGRLRLRGVALCDSLYDSFPDLGKTIV